MRVKNNFNKDEVEEPFKLGWKREIVERGNSKKQCDTYYYSPSGKKLRSIPDVLRYLDSTNDTSNLSPKNFTFSSVLISQPPNEFVRKVNCNKNLQNIELPEKKMAIKKKIKSAIQIKSTLNECNFNDIFEADSKALSCKSKGLRLIISKKNIQSSIKKEKLKSKGCNLKNTRKYVKIKSRHNHIPKSYDIVKKSTKLKKKIFKNTKHVRLFKKRNIVSNEDINRIDLCSLNCKNLEGILPSLNCDFCMCSFHPQCVNAKSLNNFTCSSCKEHLVKPNISSTPVSNTENKELSISKSSIQIGQKIKDEPVVDTSCWRILTIPLSALQQQLDLSRNINLTIDGLTYSIPSNCILKTEQNLQICIPV